MARQNRPEQAIYLIAAGTAGIEHDLATSFEQLSALLSFPWRATPGGGFAALEAAVAARMGTGSVD